MDYEAAIEREIHEVHTLLTHLVQSYAPGSMDHGRIPTKSFARLRSRFDVNFPIVMPAGTMLTAQQLLVSLRAGLARILHQSAVSLVVTS